MIELHLVVPGDIDDPAAPSGGNIYDRRVCSGLAAAGVPVREHAVPGAWPRPGDAEREALAQILAALPTHDTVLLDGLVACAAGDVLAAQAHRLRLIVLVHLPLGDDSPQARPSEGRALSSAAAVVTTSEWSRRRVIELYDVPPDRVHAAPPGVDPAPFAAPSPGGTRLLCVAAVAPHKGHDVLLTSLGAIADLPWTCTCVGSLDHDPGFADLLARRARADRLADRISFTGPRTGPDLHARYAAADLLVLASRGETYGMVVTEALARGIPVVATATKGLPEALGTATGGDPPGILVAPGDPTALAVALRRWLTDPELRQRLRRSARDRRATLSGWDTTARQISTVLSRVATRVGAR